MPATSDPELPADGTIVRARPAGWDEVIPPELAFDLEPRDPAETAGWLEGPIAVIRETMRDGRPITVVTVGKREADPKTVEVVRG